MDITNLTGTSSCRALRSINLLDCGVSEAGFMTLLMYRPQLMHIASGR